MIKNVLVGHCRIRAVKVYAGGHRLPLSVSQNGA